MSTPWSNVRIRPGDTVLSTITGSPCLCAIVGNLGEIRNVVLRIADGFQIHQPRVLIHQLVDLSGMIGIEEAHLDAQLLEGLREQRPGASIQIGRSNEILAGMRDGKNRGVHGRLSAGKYEPSDAAINRGQSLLQHIVGRIHDPRIDVAELLKPEKPCGVVYVVEGEAGGGVNRHSSGMRKRIGCVAGMKCERAKALWFCWIGHENLRLASEACVRTA